MTSQTLTSSTPTLAHIPLSQLRASPHNVRKHGPLRIDALAASIQRHGLIQPLTVVANPDGTYATIAGGRRLKALQKLAASDDPSAIHEVACLISVSTADHDRVATSLAENIDRLDMDELDQCHAIQKMIATGATPAVIGQVLGISQATLQKRLALSRLAKPVQAAYRRGDITMTALKALTSAPKARQLDYLAALDTHERPSDHALRDWLRQTSIPVTAALFDLTAYTGAIEANLFDENRYFLDVDQFWVLQNASINRLISQLTTDGWQTVLRLERGERFAPWVHETCSKSRGGCAFLEVRTNGEVSQHLGYKPPTPDHRPDVVSPVAPDPTEPRPSARLTAYITTYRHTVVQAATLKASPALALRLALAHIIGRSANWCITPTLPRCDLGHDVAAELDDLPNPIALRAAIVAAEHQVGTSLFSGNAQPAEVFNVLLTLSDAQIATVFATVVAASLDAAAEIIDGMAPELDLDPAWVCTDGFLSLVRQKAPLVALLAEVAPTTPPSLTAAGLRQDIKTAASHDPHWCPSALGFPIQRVPISRHQP